MALTTEERARILGEAKHTPGPWTVEACFRYDRHTQTRIPDGWEIHGPEHQGIAGIVEHEADGPLIAAAPEMLEALAAIVDAGYRGDEIGGKLLAQAEAAIRKARGL